MGEKEERDRDWRENRERKEERGEREERERRVREEKARARMCVRAHAVLGYHTWSHVGGREGYLIHPQCRALVASLPSTT